MEFPNSSPRPEGEGMGVRVLTKPLITNPLTAQGSQPESKEASQPERLFLHLPRNYCAG
jgi:hypothetical protein